MVEKDHELAGGSIKTRLFRGFARVRGAVSRPDRSFKRRLDRWFARQTDARAQTYSAGMMGLSPLALAVLTDSAASDLAFVAQNPEMVLSSVVPLQAGGGLGSALCQLGAGALISAMLYLGGLALIIKSIGAFYSAFANRSSKGSGSKGQAGSDFGNGAMMLVGGVVVGGFPILLNAVGVTLLSCVDPVQFVTG